MFFEFLHAILGKLLFFTSAIGGKGSFPKPLPPEEEAKYLRLAAEGDKAAKDMLVKHNMRLVAHIVKKYSGAAETDDLISVGSIGLIKAIDTYRPGRGTQLATYTARCIENEILMLIRSNKKHKNNVYLFDPVGVDKEGNELTLMDLLFEKEDGVFRAVESELVKEKFMKVLSDTLTEREYTVLCLRYGLKGGAPMPQREVAAFPENFPFLYLAHRKARHRKGARGRQRERFLRLSIHCLQCGRIRCRKVLARRRFRPFGWQNFQKIVYTGRHPCYNYIVDEPRRCGGERGQAAEKPRRNLNDLFQLQKEYGDALHRAGRGRRLFVRRLLRKARRGGGIRR